MRVWLSELKDLPNSPIIEERENKMKPLRKELPGSAELQLENRLECLV